MCVGHVKKNRLRAQLERGLSLIFYLDTNCDVMSILQKNKMAFVPQFYRFRSIHIYHSMFLG